MTLWRCGSEAATCRDRGLQLYGKAPPSDGDTPDHWDPQAATSNTTLVTEYMLSHGCVLSSTPTGQRATSFDLAEQGLGIWTESCWWCGVVSTEPVLRAGHPHPPLPTTQNKGADAPYHTMCSYTNPPWSSRWTVWTGESGMEVGSNVTCEWSPCGSSCRHGVSS